MARAIKATTNVSSRKPTSRSTSAHHPASQPVVVVRHNDTEEVLLAVDGDSLRGRDLSGAKLSGAAMYAIEVVGARSADASLLGLDDRKACLSGVVLAQADLSGAVFSEEIINNTILSGANLEDSTFVRTHFIRTDLTAANFAGARMRHTTFADCPTLGAAVAVLKHLVLFACNCQWSRHMSARGQVSVRSVVRTGQSPHCDPPQWLHFGMNVKRAV
jgi:uncharacterized protein YjbI with pentapeptide repeats